MRVLCQSGQSWNHESGGHRLRVLVVDDETEMRSLLQAILSREGVEVVGAADGATAIALTAGHRFDVVVLDLGLPDLSAEEVLLGMRRHDPSVAVAVLTGNAPTTDRARRMLHGADAYFVKPFSVRELVACVLRLGGRRSSTG